MATVPFSIRLDENLKTQLEEQAVVEERSASFLASKAIKAMLDAKAAKREAIERALEEADKGIFVSQDAMHRWMDSWGSENELPPPKPDIFPSSGKT